MVTTPPGVTVATDGLVLTQVPPVVGVKVTLPLIQTAVLETVTTGKGFTVTDEVVALQELVLVKVKLTEPWSTMVTTPPAVTVATDGLVLTQVPPEVGVNVNVPSTQTAALETVTTGNGFTVTDEVVALQELVLVNVKLTEPELTRVTTPPAVTVATDGLVLTHVPPVVGVKVILPLIQTDVLETVTTGKGLTVTEEVVALQELVLVKVKLTEP